MESISSYGWEIWTLDYKLKKKKIRYRNGFLEKSKDLQTVNTKKRSN